MKKGIVSGVAMIVLLSTVFFPSIAMARIYIVGDDNGWRSGVDYKAWAANKFFIVGDVLVFRYETGKDHVYQVDGPSFQSCRTPISGGWSSGNDFITLSGPGLQWFIGDHCNEGQKFAINVFLGFPFALPPFLPPSPSPSPSN